MSVFTREINTFLFRLMPILAKFKDQQRKCYKGHPNGCVNEYVGKDRSDCDQGQTLNHEEVIVMV